MCIFPCLFQDKNSKEISRIPILQMWTNLKKAPVQIKGRVGLLVNESRGPDHSLLKSQVGGNKSLLYFGGWQLERRTDYCPQAHFPAPSPTDKQWARGFIGGGRGLHCSSAKSTVSSGSHLEFDHGVISSRHFDCFLYSQSSVPGLG